ncbi:hypothetical protein BGX28_006414 [Mortierella sp. GBA30]|nr:hypothetical protein BGX28_006414 [Mortierella sp. GBA30]
MKSIAIFAAVAISAVAAQSAGADEGRLFYTEPITATVWTAGQSQTVAWSNVCKEQNTGDLDIVLYLGTDTSETDQVRVPGIPAIGTLNCLKSKSAVVNIPANLTTSNKYSIHVETEPLQSYSSRFTIKGIDPVTTAPHPRTTPATASATGAPTSAAGGHASGSAPAQSTPSNSNKDSAAGSLKTLGSAAVVLAAAVGSMLL